MGNCLIVIVLYNLVELEGVIDCVLMFKYGCIVNDY